MRRQFVGYLGLAAALLAAAAAGMPASGRACAQDPAPTVQDLQRLIEDQGRRLQQLEGRRPQETPSADAPATGAPPQEFESLQARLESIESRVAQEVEEFQATFLDSSSTEALRSTTGRIHLDYWAFPQDSPGVNILENGSPTQPPEDRFELRRIRFGVRGSVPPKNVSYQLDLEFSSAGSGRVSVRDAWVGLDKLPILNTLRIGNQKRPYSLDQLNSSNFMIFMERAFISDGVDFPNRLLGLASYSVSDDKVWNWRYGVFNLVPIENTGSIVSNHYQLELAGRLACTPLYDENSDGRRYLHLALSSVFAFPENNPEETAARFSTRPEARSSNQWLNTGAIGGSTSYQLLGSELVFNLGSIQFGGEYLPIWLQRESSVGPDLFLHGGYVYLSYFLTGEHLPWNRDLGILGRLQPLEDFIHQDRRRVCGIGAWQVAARLSHADFNDENILGGIGTSATFAVNWYWNSHSRLQFNYLVGQIDNRLASLTAGGTEVVSGHYQIAGVRCMIDF